MSGRSRPATIRRSVDLPLPLGPRSAVSEPGLDLERHVVERDELAEPLADPGDLDAHAVASFGLRKIIAIRTRMAMTASTIEIE